MYINNDILFHDGTEYFCKCNETDGVYKIILSADKGTINSAFVCVNENLIPMSLEMQESNFSYYSATIPFDKDVIRYYFKATTNNGDIYYNMLGVTDAPNENGYFEVTPGFETPDWAKGAVMYQIMVDRFCNGDKSNDVVDDEHIYINKRYLCL